MKRLSVLLILVLVVGCGPLFSNTPDVNITMTAQRNGESINATLCTNVALENVQFYFSSDPRDYDVLIGNVPANSCTTHGWENIPQTACSADGYLAGGGIFPQYFNRLCTPELPDGV